MHIAEKSPKICLTIAGVDPSGGAGVIADIKTFFAFGCYPAAVIASLTFQNTTAVFGVENQTGDVVRKQAVPVFDDLAVDAVKTGMLPNRDVIETVAELIREYNIQKLVVDPVVRSTTGFDLIDDEALRAMIERLFPLASIVTPNIPETERISQMTITTLEDVHAAGKKILEMGPKAVLIKGGHLPDLESPKMARDYLFTADGVFTFEAEYYDTDATHGTGCTLAAAITANLALGNDLKTSVETAKDFVNEAIRTAPKIGKGNSPLNIQPIGRRG
ncbi:MAG: bifunctional hydroxymethylpyrimidine kinase/phosphomethylpyrimidine kinase [Acidobacteria bacterium]|nr:bifunctional hydroxymethylpyrimidine kinase/phosphomethylpyrimidine kinase [Acidobacteriota bacterium]